MARGRPKLRPSKPLPITSWSRSDTQFQLDDVTFGELENCLGGPIQDEARRALQALCDDFIDDREREFAQKSFDDVRLLLPRLEAASAALWTLLYPDGKRSDATYYFESIVERQLAAQPATFRDLDDLLHLDATPNTGWVPIGDRFEMPDGGYAVRLSKNVLESIAQSIAVALGGVRKELAERESEAHAEPGVSARKKLLVALRQWAKLNNFRYGEQVDGYNPSPFANFSASLLDKVPEKYRDNLSNKPGALVEQLKQARAIER